MTIVICDHIDCVNRGTDVCKAHRIKLNVYGDCDQYETYDHFMRRKPTPSSKRVIK